MAVLGCVVSGARTSLDCSQDKNGKMQWKSKRHEKCFDEKFSDTGAEGDY
jgi:hypothetical protein